MIGKLARLVVQIVGETEAYEEALSSTLNTAKSWAGSIGSLIVTAVTTAFVAAGTAVTGFAVASTVAFGNFQQGINEVYSLLPGISQSAMTAMSDDVKQFSEDFSVLPSEVIPALYEALSSGVPQDNVFDFMAVAQKAAVGGVTELKTAVDGITSVVNSYGADVIDAGRASDIMFTAVKLGKTTFGELSQSIYNVLPSAAALGVSFEDVSAQLAVLTAKGVPTTVATTQIRSALTELSDSTAKLSGAVEDVTGRSFTDLIAQGYTVSQILNAVRSSMPEQQFRDLFGRVEALNAALSITGPNADAAASAFEQMKNSAGATDAAYNQMAQGINFSMKTLKSFAAVALVDVGEALSPMVQRVLQLATEALPYLQSALQDQLLPAIGKVADIFNLFVDNLKAGDAPLAALRGAMEGIIPDASLQRFDSLVKTAKSFSDWIVANGDNIINTLIAVGTIIATYATLSTLVSVVGAVVGAITGLSAAFAAAGTVVGGVVAVLGGPLFVTLGAIALAVGALAVAWRTDWGNIRTDLTEFANNFASTYGSYRATVDGAIATNHELAVSANDPITEFAKLNEALRVTQDTWLGWVPSISNAQDQLKQSMAEVIAQSDALKESDAAWHESMAAGSSITTANAAANIQLKVSLQQVYGSTVDVRDGMVYVRGEAIATTAALHGLRQQLILNNMAQEAGAKVKEAIAAATNAAAEETKAYVDMTAEEQAAVNAANAEYFRKHEGLEAVRLGTVGATEAMIAEREAEADLIAQNDALANSNAYVRMSHEKLAETVRSSFSGMDSSINDLFDAYADLSKNQGEWVSTTRDNTKEVAEISAQLANDLSSDRKKEMQDALSTYTEGGAEWLATYKALQGDLTDAQRAELVARMADLQASQGEAMSVYTGDAEAAEEAQKAIDAAMKAISESHRQMVLDIYIQNANLQGGFDESAANIAVAMGLMTRDEADFRLSVQETNRQVGVLGDSLIATFMQDGSISRSEADLLQAAIKGVEDGTFTAGEAILAFRNGGLQGLIDGTVIAGQETDNLGEKLGLLPETAEASATGMANAFTNKPWASIGDGAAQGVASGFSGSSALISAAEEAVWKMIGAAKAAAGIRSPSTLAAAEVGDPIGQGTAIGAVRSITAAQPALANAVRGMVGGVSKMTAGLTAELSPIQNMVLAVNSLSDSLTAVPTDVQAKVNVTATGREDAGRMASKLGRRGGTGLVEPAYNIANQTALQPTAESGAFSGSIVIQKLENHVYAAPGQSPEEIAEAVTQEQGQKVRAYVYSGRLARGNG